MVKGKHLITGWDGADGGVETEKHLKTMREKAKGKYGYSLQWKYNLLILSVIVIYDIFKYLFDIIDFRGIWS